MPYGEHMVQKIVVQRTSDISGETDAIETRFGSEGVEYVIDLTPEEAVSLREALAPFVDAARPDSTKSTRGRGRRRAPRPGPADGTVKTSTVRKWAEEQGMISENTRGRLSADVWDEYAAAHPGAPLPAS